MLCLEEGHIVRDPQRLLKVVRHEHQGVINGQLQHELLYRVRGDGVQGGAGLVEQQHLRVHCQAPGDRQPLLLPTRQLASGLGQLALDLVPQPSSRQTIVDKAVEVLRSSLESRTIGNVVEDRLREDIRLLKHHADAPPN